MTTMNGNHSYDAPPSTTFKLGEREYRWAYSTNAAIRLEAALGDDAIDQLRILRPSAPGEPMQLAKRLTVLRALVWAGMEDEPELSVEKIGALLRPEDTMELALSLLQSMSQGLQRNPTEAATATEASAAGQVADSLA